MKKNISCLAGVFLLLSGSLAHAEDKLFTDAIDVLKGMEEKTAAVKMCGAGLMEKGKETKNVFEKIIETCACCTDAYRCCYTLACNPCQELEVKETENPADKMR
jgi:hypothetical protein